MARDSPVKFARDAANRRLVADVRRSQPAAGQSTEVFAKFENHRAASHAGGLHRGGNSRARAAINADFCLDRLGCSQRNQGEQTC
jgi:hypothetical protein